MTLDLLSRNVDGMSAAENAPDPLWARLRQEAAQAHERAPELAPLFFDSIIAQPSLEDAIFHRMAMRLKSDVVGHPILVDAFARAAEADASIGRAIRADLACVLERDPACRRLIEPFLYFKGFHAIQTHRLAHWLWSHDERDFALYLQSRSSDVFQTDIHPAAQFGEGIFLDHATGLVVGERTVVEDGVSLLQAVTLGGTGNERDDRHPKIGRGAIIGAGAKVLGNIEVGACARVAAGAIVLRAVPRGATVAGVPAKIVRSAESIEPDRPIGQILSRLAYDSVFDYSI